MNADPDPSDSANVVAAKRCFYSDDIGAFLNRPSEYALGCLTAASQNVDRLQTNAWIAQLELLHDTLAGFDPNGRVYFEYVIPRLGKRIDCLVVLQHVLFVIEFKIGESEFTTSGLDQVWDYALDLKNFHETSHEALIVPLLVATEANPAQFAVRGTIHDDRLMRPVRVGRDQLAPIMRECLEQLRGSAIAVEDWESGRYLPTPTIVEAARALYAGHSVEQISRSDAGATNLQRTSKAVDRIIADSRARKQKSICFVTGVPGAGKTLVGLDVATRHMDVSSELYTVFLSGNGPLVAVLREALARDRVAQTDSGAARMRIGDARREVSAFIQNVHHFRDACISDLHRPPIEHVALFDEAQRAWDREQTSAFMKRKKGHADFAQSEPEFLISCLDRHSDWATVVCLVGGGQEINTGEAGISEWVEALSRRFAHWDIYVSPQLRGTEYRAEEVLDRLGALPKVHFDSDLHLATSMRSFRAETLSDFVKRLLDLEIASAREAYCALESRYPIFLTRCILRAKSWLREQARGTERCGIIVSSQAQRLKPLAIDVRVSVDPVHWFLHEKDDPRSSYYLEDVATEFQVQGLELDWAAVVWDGDFRFSESGWQHHEFVGARWRHVRAENRKRYLANAYRVLLTRARQGMVIVVPEGDSADPTRAAENYDSTFIYLRSLGLPILQSTASANG